MSTFKTTGVCARSINFEVEGETIKSVQFVGGCAGNTQGVARLIEGMNIDEAIRRMEGIECGVKGTSCPDQLAKALKSYKEHNN
ncbi:MAG: TIGR03905 family TSCPD domain-containing protein [Lachnospiraceae bacterium]